MADRFLLTLEVSATYVGAAPTLEVLVGGAVASSSTVLAHTGIGTNTFEYSLDFTNSPLSSLAFRFNDGSPEGGRNISFAHVYVNGQEINAAYLSQLLVTQGQSNSVTVASVAYLFGRTEPVTADLGAATITGTAGANTINGTAGDDVIDGLAGNDRIDGKAGNDKITGGTNDDTIYGGIGNDLVMGDTGNDRIFGNDGNDLLYGNAGNDIINGGAGNDVMSGGDNNDTMLGGSGNDILYGGAGIDTLSGDLGDDYLYGDDGIDLMAGGIGSDVMYGGNGTDSMDGGAGNDTMYGEGDADMMNGGANDDTMDGGAGNDQINGGTGADTMSGGAGDDVIVGDVGNDTLNGDADNDVLSGGSGNDTINGGDGDDRLYGHALTSAAASTILSANPGVVYDATSNSFYKLITGAATLAAATAAATATILSGIAGHLVTITSAAENTRVLSIAAGNTVWLGGSDATDEGVWTWGAGYENGLQFWAGAAGGSAANGFYTNWAGGKPDDAGNADGMTMGAAGTWSDQTVGSTFAYIIEWDAISFSDDSGIDTLSGGNGNDILWGGAGADTLAGDANDDKIYGGTGNDTITGGDGDDILTGNGGTDNINGGNGTDMINYITAAAAVTVNLATGSATSDGDGATDTISNIENVNGSNFNDTITGDGNANVIYGNAGNDTITGGAGADTLYGGAGNDTFNLANNDFAAGEIIDGGAAATVDTITLTNATTVDFTTGTLSGIETLTGSGSNDDVTVGISHALTVATGGMFSTVNLGGGTDAFNARVSGTVSISAASLLALSGVENRSLLGSGGNDVLTLTAAQMDAMVIGAGIIDFGAGAADTINLNGTSTSLNAAGSTDDSFIDGVEVISFAAGSAITVDLSLQTEGFTLTGTTAADTITTGDGDDIITAGGGVDTIAAGEGTNTINLANSDFASGESITGGAGDDTIVLTNATTVDFTTGTLVGMDILTGSGGNDTVTLLATYVVGQFTIIDMAGGTDTLNTRVSGAMDISAGDVTAISNVETSNLTGTAAVDTLTATGEQLDAILSGTSSNTINFGASTDVLNLLSTSARLNTLGATDAAILGLETISASTAAAGVTITLGSQTEAFTITGSGFNDTLTGGSAADIITGGVGVDTINGGAGNDTINLANGDFDTAESITGGANTDSIVFTNATTVDFTTGTLATVETLTGSGSGDTATMTASQFNLFSTINMGGGTDTMNVTVSGTLDISGTNPTPTFAGIENGNLTGSGGDDAFTLTGAQLDGMLGGTTGTVAMGAGDDTIILTSTSARFNTTAATDGSITGLEAITVSGSPAITINISGQTESFTINGGGGVDTITGGRGDTTIYGNAGNDIITSSSIDTLAAQAAAIVAANSGVTYNSTTDSFYKYVTSTVNWTAANTAAVGTVINGVAGHLVQINNAAENTAIDTLAAGNEVWLGISDVAVADQWLLMGGIMDGIQFWQGQGAGSAVNFMYENWSAGEPNNSGSPSYARMLADGTWADQADATNERYIIEWEGSRLIFSTSSTTIVGGAGADTITGGAGKDTFMFDTASAGSIDTINGFNMAHHDALDISQLLSGYVAGTSDVDDFARLTVSGANLLLQVDANGTTGGTSFTTVATLVNLGTSGLNVTDMVEKRSLVLSVPTISFYFDWGTGNYTHNSNQIASTTFTNTTIGRAPMNGTDEFSITRTSSTATLDYLNATAPGTLIVTGSSEDDRINISGIISALTGTVNLNAGNDRLTITSAGNFTINGGIGNDTIAAGAGNDIITGGTGIDTMDGGNGNDTFNLASGDWSAGESITGGAGTDVLVLTNAQTVDFTTGTLATLDTLTGSTGNDVLTMTLLQFAQFSTVNLGTGTNTVSVTVSGTVNSTGLAATPTVTNVTTGSLTGSAGVDTITMTGGQLDGIMNGAGIIDFAGGTDVLNLTSTSTDLNTLGGTNASIVNLETISASGAAAGVTITLTAQTEGFTLTGSGFDDIITGGSGADTVEGGAGNDTLNGNGGTDTVTYANAGSAVTVSLAVLIGQNTGGAGTDTLASFENLTGSAFNDTLTGDGNANTINGLLGDDTIYGGGNNDTLNGGGGSDVMYGEAGNDTINSGSTDTLTALAAAIVAANAGVIYNAATGSFYKYITTTATWTAADAAAAGTLINGVAGHLVQINNSTENTQIDTLTTNRDVWMGLSDSGTEDSWVYMGGVMNGILAWSGNGVDAGGSAQNGIYNNWRTSGGTDQPNGGGSTTEDYGRFRDGGTWSDQLNTSGPYRYVIEWEGSVLMTPTNTTTLNGGLGNDTLNGGAGQDIFHFDANAWGAGNADTVNNYDRTDIDKLDIADLLTGYTAGISDDDLFARFVDTGNDLALQVDRDGSGGVYAFTTVATLVGQGASTALVQLYNVEEFVANGLLVMT